VSRVPLRQLAAMAALFACIGCEPAPVAPAVETSTAAPSQVLKEFELQDIRDGAKAMTLKATEGRLFDENQYAELERPNVTFFKEGGVVSSLLRAPSGKVYMKTHEIEAWGGVTVVTPDSSTLTTPTLRYDPDRRKIHTKDTVVLDKPDSVTEGEGLEADPGLKSVKIGRQRVRLKSAQGSK
jgi:LPS export ABC transporter protein LptC